MSKGKMCNGCKDIFGEHLNFTHVGVFCDNCYKRKLRESLEHYKEKVEELESNTREMLKWLDLYWAVTNPHLFPDDCPVCKELDRECEGESCESTAWGKYEMYRKLVEGRGGE